MPVRTATAAPRTVSPRPAIAAISIALLALVAALSACGDSNAPSAPFSVATRLAALDGNAQTAAVNAAEPAPIRVQVLDQSGKPMAGVPLTWTVTGSGGTLSAQSLVTDSAGVGSAVWTLGTMAGVDTVTVATSPAGPATLGATTLAASPVVFTATASAGPAASVAVVSGNQQSGSAGSVLAAPLAVRVVDAFGNPVAGTTVTWATPSQGTLASATAVTDSTGLASDTFTLDAAPGTDPVIASVTLPDGTSANAMFTEQGS